MITVTRRAAMKIYEQMKAGHMESLGLRLAAKVGPDGDIQIGMGFDHEREHDQVQEATGVTLLIAPASREMLAGLTVDIEEQGDGQFRFVFLPPKEAPEEGEAAAEGGA